MRRAILYLVASFALAPGCYNSEQLTGDAGPRLTDDGGLGLRDASTTPRADAGMTPTTDAGLELDAGPELDAGSGVGADVRRGVLSPDLVYLAGTLSEGACYVDALAHYSAPDAATVGFDCYYDQRQAQITPDGRLLYTNTFEDLLREFHCDGCPGWRPGDPYPADPLLNDPILPTPPCDPSGITSHLQLFRVSPDGRRAHSCGGREWYDETGAAVFDSGFDAVVSYGWAGHVLLQSPSGGAILDTVAGTRTPTTGLPDCTWITTRACIGSA